MCVCVGGGGGGGGGHKQRSSAAHVRLFPVKYMYLASLSLLSLAVNGANCSKAKRIHHQLTATEVLRQVPTG